MLHNKIHIILIHLGLTDENKVGIVVGGKVFKTVNAVESPSMFQDIAEKVWNLTLSKGSESGASTFNVELSAAVSLKRPEGLQHHRR